MSSSGNKQYFCKRRRKLRYFTVGSLVIHNWCRAALMHPLSGNKLVRDTLTCYEREVGSAQPTVAAGLQRSGSGSDSPHA